MILRLFGRISRGEGEGKFGEENQDFKTKLGWGRISRFREFYTALYFRLELVEMLKAGHLDDLDVELADTTTDPDILGGIKNIFK